MTPSDLPPMPADAVNVPYLLGIHGGALTWVRCAVDTSARDAARGTSAPRGAAAYVPLVVRLPDGMTHLGPVTPTPPAHADDASRG